MQGFLRNGENAPIRSLRIIIEEDQRDELFARLKKFADAHALEYNLTFYDAAKKIFLVEIYGNGFHITASDVPDSPKEIDISFFNETSTRLPQTTVDELFKELKDDISGIPNVTITEQK
jgi:hypothetical protein